MPRAYKLSPETRAGLAAAISSSWQDPDVRERRVAAISASWKDPDSRNRRIIAIAESWAAKAWAARAPKVPEWCPPSLAAEYLSRALEYDEFDAAKHIRSLLREAK
jgi:hypothetical protein